MKGADNILTELGGEAVFGWLLQRDDEDVAVTGEVQIGELGQIFWSHDGLFLGILN